MKHYCSHVSDDQLQVLLFKSEDELETTEIAQHVESCETCQIRLTEIVNEESVEQEVGRLLSGYDESARVFSNCSISAIPSDAPFESYLDKVLLEPPTHPEMLGRIGRYEIERRIGSGGMGVVFKAIDTELNRPVAVKVLAPHLARNGAARQRFSRESRAAAAVVHEHVVAIHNVDSSAEHPYLVMQYVSGESLQSRVEREGPQGVERILRIGIQAALGLSAAHQQGIVHRDIKPANILLEDGVDRLLITDFGLARTVDDASLTHTGVVAGTPNYMSPEQASGDEVDHRTDLFSLGSVLYFVATGHPPFRAERAMGVLHRICRERHRPVWQVNAAIRDDLSKVIDRLLEKRPAKRYASAAAVADALTRILQQVQNQRPSVSTRLGSWGRRHLRTCAVVATVWVVVAGLTTWSLLSPSSFERQAFIPAGSKQQDLQKGAQSDSADVISERSTNAKTQNRNEHQSVTGSGNARDDIDATGDRTAFDRSLDFVETSLNELDKHGTSPVSDSFQEFQLELNAFDQALRKIDPTLK